MARKKKELPVLEDVLITGLAAEGKAIAKVNDVVVFAPFVVPGDVVDLQVTRKKSHFMEARAIRIKKLSDKRNEVVCRHFGVCGGCKWQMLPYAEQIRYKQQQVEDNLTRIAKVEIPEISPIIGSGKTEFYRNKLEFTFSNKRWRTHEEMALQKDFDTVNALGFHIPGMFDMVLDIEMCWLQDDISNRIRNEIRRYAVENNLEFFDLKRQEGFLRTMIIRTASTGELMLILSFFREDENERIKLLQHVSECFPQITSLLYCINSKANDTITDQEIHLFRGNKCIYEEMEGLRFKIGPKSFYQTNSEQAYELYKIVRNFAQLKGNELVYDLYTGTGTIANFVAGQVGQVVGIEYVPEAIEDAKENSRCNGITNTLFYAGDIKDILTEEFIRRHGNPNVIITDPPRAGMHQDVIDAILLANPGRIVYVSCNPATQSRDIALLDARYKLTAIQPVDMFPHTHHVENVVLMERR
ncbi:MAG: 23S rRNA (uracil(1939)-C(5))-methyltransferase RlmD [Prevotellaceae bacterium]|jgi:23S rRNA (uracil1939-C5)-methyltransferase|nr:23S rRNA (uracil(1939)-C(5))-methyltransferase RlmD [Prevotellaceae bacterium]